MTRIPAGNALRATLIMGMATLAAWVVIDRWQSQPDPQFFADDIPLFAWYVLGILTLAALLQWRARPSLEFRSVLALAMGAVPVPLLFTSVAAVYLNPDGLLAGAILVGLYTLLYLARGLHAITGATQRTAACVGVVFIAGFCWLSDTLDVIPDVWAPLETQATQSDEALADGEAVLFSQAARIDRALEAVGRETSPGPRVFFLGFAGVGEQKVFAQEIGLASRVIGERYDTGARRLSLINDQRDLEGAPLATVTGLKYALHGLGSRMNLERDVLFLAISSHGTDDPAIAVSNSQLPLQDLAPEDLADALRESGIRWRVIIISACYAGGFIDSLKGPQTIVIAAAAADRSSFGCSNDSDLTYFGEAFYRDALPAAGSLRAAFDTAKAAIAARERREHVTPSNPQAYFGKALEEKVASMSAAKPLNSPHRK
ncbi:MAG: C13 family peptidase [Steroidobacteraceae bacterium]